MKIWILKAIIQKTISFLPYKHNINYLFQKYITKGIVLTDELFETKLKHCAQHLHSFKTYSSSVSMNCFELGTGWYPIVPIGLYLNNADLIYTADISNLLTKDRLYSTILKFESFHNSGKLIEILPNINPAKLEVLLSIIEKNIDLKDALNQLNIKTYLGDICDIDPGSIPKMDLINSNNTFEHITPFQLNKILIFFTKIFAVEGIMSHFIDLSDHFSHFDKSITPYNFLKFNDKQWNLIDNSIQPQNRLRISDYRRIFSQTEWEIINEINTVPPINLDISQVASNFQSISIENLMVSHSLITANIKKTRHEIPN